MATTAVIGGCSLLIGSGFSGDDEGPPQGDDASTREDVGSSGGDGAAAKDTGVDGGNPSDTGTQREGCPPPLADPALAAWYPFEDDGANGILDCSGHGLDGTLGAGGTFTRIAGRPGAGQAISIGPTPGCFDLGVAASLAFSATSSFTVTAWIKPRTHSYPDPDGGTDPKPRWFADRFVGGAIQKGWGLGTDDTESATGFVEVKSFRGFDNFTEAEGLLGPSAWRHVAGLFTPTTVGVYVNGALLREVELATPTPSETSAHAWIGCRGGDEPSFDGLLDDVRVYARALSVAELEALAQQ
jgi:hypothetical protein